MRRSRWFLVGLIVLLVSGARSPALARTKGKAAGESAEKGSRKALAEVVEGTEKQAGLLTFHRSPDKLYLELSEELLGVDLGFAAVQVNALGDFSMRGTVLDSQLVRWQRRGDHIVLQKENLDFRAIPGSSMNGVIASSFPDSPAFAAALVPLRGEPAPLLVDASKLFGPDLVQLLPERTGFSVRPEDALLLSLAVFPDNVVARVSYRVRGNGEGAPTPPAGEDAFARFLRPGRLADPRVAELIVDYNLYRLPSGDFEPRWADERIGGFVQAHKDYDDVEGRDTLFRHLLSRWDVRGPIRFYMDPSVPARFRPLVREGALWWNTAFRKIGVEDAVQVLDAPAEGWDPADIHHSVIYWNISDDLVFSGAAGPVLVDPRNGRVLKANVHLNGEFFSYALDRYLVYAWWRAPQPGATAMPRWREEDGRRAMQGRAMFCDRAASFSSQLAFARLVLGARGVIRPGTEEADRFAREAFLELVAHEVGHALGFPHNWKASLISSWEDVRTGRVDGGTSGPPFSASVMDYNPIYLAPRGAVQGDYFLGGVGPYDDLAVEYLYRPLEHESQAERVRILDAIAARAETEHGLIYDSGLLGDIDPTTNSDDLGDDPLAFAESRLVLLQEEVLPRLPELVLAEGHDYNLLRQALDSAVFSVALDYIDMTARHVGGQILHRRVASSPASPAGGAAPIEPVPPAVQRRALDILERRVFAEGAFALTPAVLSQLKADLMFDWNYPWRYASDYDLGGRIAGLYDAALGTLLAPRRLTRILDNERRVVGTDRFTLPELFDRLEKVAFARLAPAVEADGRSLQRLLVAHASRLVLHPDGGTPAEASQVAAATLRSIRRRIERVLEAGESRLDGYTRAHLIDLAARATKTLDAGYELGASR